jgi:Uma2 family endonuclease
MVSIRRVEHTIEDLMDLPEDQKAELIDGEIYMMAPASALHSFVAAELCGKISQHCRKIGKKSDGGKGDSRLLIFSEAWTYYDEYNSFVHDLAGFYENDLPVLPKRGPIMAKPHWVCEIISPSNWSRDTQVKRVVLEEYGVPYYWLVDPERSSIQVFKLLEGAKHYQIECAVGVEDGIVKLKPFEDLKLDLREIFRS